jgi:hypothetical protein
MSQTAYISCEDSESLGSGQTLKSGRDVVETKLNLTEENIIFTEK